jgi:hypothetical protein
MRIGYFTAASSASTIASTRQVEPGGSGSPSWWAALDREGPGEERLVNRADGHDQLDPIRVVGAREPNLLERRRRG